MAIFNPQEPTVQEPNYLGYSKAISTPDFKSTAGAALKGFGDIFQEAAKGADAYIEDKAKTETRDTLEAARNAYTEDLTTADRLTRYAANLQPASNVSINQLGPDPTNILANSPGTNVPDDIKNLPQNLGVLKGARDSGKLSESDFYGRTAAMLKDIRAKYPNAYRRDVIDAEGAKVLGTNPANAYVKGLISDFNKNLTDTQAQRTHMANELLKGLQFDGGEVAYKRFLAGGSIEDAASFLAPNMRRMYQRSEAEADLKLRQTQGTANKEWYTLNAKESANSILQETLHSIKWNTGIKSFDDMNQLIVDGYSGKANLTSEQWAQLGNLPLAYKQRVLAKVDADFAKVRAGGVSYNGQVDTAELSKIKDGIEKTFDTMHKAFASKDIGMAYDAMRRVTALEGDARLNLVKDKDIGGVMLGLNAWQATVGPQIVEKSNIQDILAKITGPFKKMLDTARTDLTVDDPRHTPDFKTFKEAADALIAAKAGENPDYAVQFPKTWDRLMGMIDDPETGLVSPNLPEKAKAVRFSKIFSRENAGLLRNIAPDARDSKGRLVVGAESTFARFSNPDVVEVAKKQGPQALANYLDFIKTTWETDLFKPQLLSLKSMASAGKVSGDKDWGLKWNTDNHELEIYDKSRPGFNLLRREEFVDSPFSRAKAVVARLNTGFHALSNVAEATNQDADHYILANLVSALGKGTVDEKGKVTGFDVTKIEGLPSDILNSIISSRADTQKLLQKRKEDEKYKLK